MFPSQGSDGTVYLIGYCKLISYVGQLSAGLLLQPFISKFQFSKNFQIHLTT